MAKKNNGRITWSKRQKRGDTRWSRVKKRVGSAIHTTAEFFRWSYFLGVIGSIVTLALNLHYHWFTISF